MAWDGEHEYLYAGKKHPPHDARLLYVLPEEFQKPNQMRPEVQTCAELVND
jgi:hypothetical protein